MTSGDDAVLATSLAPARWMVAYFEPLVDARRRLELEEATRLWAHQHPSIASAWFAGIIWQIAATLPGDDPWRQMSVHWPLPSGVTLRRGAEADNPWRGASLKGEPFGGVAAKTDVVLPSNADATLDPGLVAVQDGIEPAAAAVLALAFDSWEEPRKLLLAMSERVDMSAPLFDTAVQSMRWALWRRRAYIGRSDPYPLLTAQAWLGRAERVADGLPIDFQGCLFEVESEAIESGAWEDLSGMFNGHPFFPGL